MRNLNLKIVLGTCLLAPGLALAQFTLPPFDGGNGGGGSTPPASEVSNALVVCTLPQADGSSSCSSSGSTSSSCTSGTGITPSLVKLVNTSANMPADTQDDLKGRVGEPCQDTIEAIENSYSGSCDFSASGASLYYQCTVQ